MGISVVQTLQSTGPAPANAAAANVRPPESLADAQDENQDADLTFDDLIDVINSLHHLPIVSTIYCAITGDQSFRPCPCYGRRPVWRSARTFGYRRHYGC